MKNMLDRILEIAKPLLIKDVFTFDKFIEIKISLGGTLSDYRYMSQGDMSNVLNDIPTYLSIIIKAYEVYKIYARAYIPSSVCQVLSEYIDHIEPSDLFSRNVTKDEYLEFLKQCYLRKRIPVISSSVKIA